MDTQALVEAIRQHPEIMNTVAEVSQELEQAGVAPEVLNALGAERGCFCVYQIMNIAADCTV